MNKYKYKVCEKASIGLFFADKIKDARLKQQTEKGIKTVIEIFGEAQDISFAKFRESLKTEAQDRISDRKFKVCN